jgi:hypothetical protein
MERPQADRRPGSALGELLSRRGLAANSTQRLLPEPASHWGESLCTGVPLGVRGRLEGLVLVGAGSSRGEVRVRDGRDS